MFKHLATKFRVRAIYTRLRKWGIMEILLTFLAGLGLCGMLAGCVMEATATAPTQDPAAPPTRPAHSLDSLVIRQLSEDTQLVIAISDTGGVAIQVIRPMEVTVKR